MRARLAIPLRERNTLLVAAGYAPMYRERALDDPALAAARSGGGIVLRATDPARHRTGPLLERGGRQPRCKALLAARIGPELLAPQSTYSA